jgi:KipI family sensor histidine kinase inhibitor
VEIRSVGADALLIDVGDAALVEAWRVELLRRRGASEFAAVDIVPGAQTVLLDGVPDRAALAARLVDWTPADADAAPTGPLVTIDVTYDGPDLGTVAEHWGVSVDAVVARHVDTEFRVAFCGFAPGFAYLTGLAPELAVPRLDTPRTRVPAGSVGLADVYCGIYPRSSPGGWLLIGRTDAELFNPDRDPPALLGPGTRVRFRADLA